MPKPSQYVLSLCLLLTGLGCAPATDGPEAGAEGHAGNAAFAGDGGAMFGDDAAAAGGGSGGPGQSAQPDPCAAVGLAWKTGHKTNYESYPAPDSEECVEYNGCEWAGWFAGCENQQTEAWVSSHNIAALFPNFDTYELHEICIRHGDTTLLVTVYDTCGDTDCSGCCTRNQGDADALIDLEKTTNERWGLPDGPIEWADLGPSASADCR